MNYLGVGFKYPSILTSIVAIVGGFGSGKTEVAVNLTRFLALSEKIPIAIADLDLVNPYFRSREAIAEMEGLGVRVIAPRGGNFYADLPILLPEIRGAIEKREGRLILDVGGDVQGSRALGTLSDAFVSDKYELLMVLNSRRPFTSDVADCLKTMSRIEITAQLKFTGIIANSHMIDETTPEILIEGYRLASSVAEILELPLVFLSAKREILEKMDLLQFKCPVLPLVRSMLKPWERGIASPAACRSSKDEQVRRMTKRTND
ncbi:MAG: cobalamin biosynthesis protein CbiA [candidate division Zixibacteria bacterium]|nr:cobalamin biosynthesis protein CbiA [candidate division Zixibacteria bacterium]